jgi:hypothetical protein
LPRLKALARRGATILGMHPSGTSREEVEEFLREQQLGYPTFLAADKNDAPNAPLAWKCRRCGYCTRTRHVLDIRTNARM